MAKKLSKKEELEQIEKYIDFLEKRISSKNYKNNVPGEEFEKTKEKLKKEKLKLKLLR